MVSVHAGILLAISEQTSRTGPRIQRNGMSNIEIRANCINMFVGTITISEFLRLEVARSRLARFAFL